MLKTLSLDKVYFYSLKQTKIFAFCKDFCLKSLYFLTIICYTINI